MVLVMLITLYTTRVVLATLGVEDFGIYNVVGGIVTMFSFLSVTMSSASQRFFSYELGRDDNDNLQRVFSITILIYVFIVLLVFLLAETIGLWFLNAKMKIPAERKDAALWVYQFSIFSFLVTIMTTPYNAAIIAQENMKVYAVVSVIDVMLKLFIVYLLLLSNNDKLKLYAVLMFLVTTITQGSYFVYCKCKYKVYQYKFYWNKKIFIDMLSFSGWNMIGAVANVLRSQGINILLNLFFNPVVNAARGIAYQVNSALQSLINNFYTAVRPQIFKSYSSGHLEEMHGLVFKSAKYAYFLMLILTIPLFIEAEDVLSLWLKEVPPSAVLFSRIIMVNALLETFSAPLVNAMQATGNIKMYQLTVSVIYLFNIPISYILLRMGYPPEITMYVNIMLVLISFLPRLILCKRIASLSISKFFHDVVFISFGITILIGAVTFLIRIEVPSFFIRIVFEIGIACAIIWFCGMKANERKQILSIFVKSKRC